MGLDELEAKNKIEEWLNVHTHTDWTTVVLRSALESHLESFSVQQLHERMQTSKSIAIMAFPNGSAVK